MFSGQTRSGGNRPLRGAAEPPWTKVPWWSSKPAGAASASSQPGERAGERERGEREIDFLQLKLRDAEDILLNHVHVRVVRVQGLVSKALRANHGQSEEATTCRDCCKQIYSSSHRVKGYVQVRPACDLLTLRSIYCAQCPAEYQLRNVHSP